MSPRVLRDGKAARIEAVEVLRGGGIVALPTDTVYGIAVALDAQDGIERLFRAKKRPPEKSIALLVADAAQAWEIGVANDAAERLAAAFWPGPLTLVLERRVGAGLPGMLTAGQPTVGVRVPDHPSPRAIAGLLGPLPTTSANLSGAPDALDVAAVIAQLGDAVDLILDGGRTRGAVASTVVDCTRDPVVVLRAGVLDERRIREAVS